MTSPLWMPLTPSIAQSPEVKIVKTYPDGGYVLSIGGKLFTTLDEAQAKQIEHDRNALDAATKTIVLQTDLIASLQRQTSLEAKLDALGAAVRRLQDDQVMRLLAVIGKLDSLQAESDAIKGGMPKKSKLDSLPIKFSFMALGGAANVRELVRPNPFNPPKGSIVQEPCR